MTALPTTVTDKMVAELDAELGHDGLVELTYAIAVENHLVRFNGMSSARCLDGSVNETARGWCGAAD